MGRCLSSQSFNIAIAEIILGMGSSNKRRRYTVIPPLIAWSHTQNDPWMVLHHYDIMVCDLSYVERLLFFKSWQYIKAWTSKIKVIPQRHIVDLKFYLENPRSKSWVRSLFKVQSVSDFLSTHIAFVSCQSALPTLWYGLFKIWIWKSKVKS